MTGKNPTQRRDRDRRDLLAATLPHVAFDGWTMTALRAGAEDLGFHLGDLQRLFPGGPDEMVALFVSEADRRMSEELARRDLGNMRIRDRIATAVRVRLEQNAGHKDAIRRALALQSLPQNGPGGLASLYRTVDAMWRAAGDTATDVNFYTKRAFLSCVYVSTLIFWLNDGSEDCESTWGFLDRRIDNVLSIQKLRSRVGRYLPDPEAVLARALKKGRRVSLLRPGAQAG